MRCNVVVVAGGMLSLFLLVVSLASVGAVGVHHVEVGGDGQAAQTLLGLGVRETGMWIAKIDPNTGKVGSTIFTSSRGGKAGPLPLQQPIWDEEDKLLHIVLDIPEAGLLTLDCRNLTQVKQVSFIHSNSPLMGVQLARANGSKWLFGLSVALPPIRGLYNLVSLDLRTKCINVLKQYVSVGTIPFDYPGGATSLVADPVHNALVYPTVTVNGIYWLSYISLTNLEAINYYMSPNPVVVVVYNPSDQKVYGVVNKTNEQGNREYYWAAVNSSMVDYRSQWKALPSTNSCQPGSLALNPVDNTVYTFYGLGDKCQSASFSWLVVDAFTGAINKQLSIPIDVNLLVWVSEMKKTRNSIHK